MARPAWRLHLLLSPSLFSIKSYAKAQNLNAFGIFCSLSTSSSISSKLGNSRDENTRRNSEQLAWPLFGTAALPVMPEAARTASRRFFFRGARYLGDEGELLTPAHLGPRWVEIPFLGRSNAGKSSLLNALLGARADARGSAGGSAAFVPVSRAPGSTRHIDFYAAGSGSLATTPPALPVGGAAPRGARSRGANGVHGVSPDAVAAAAAAAAASLVLVDTPGFGFASGGAAAEMALATRLRAYLASRAATAAPASVPRAVMLLDSRLGVTARDADVLRLLDDARVPYLLVLTKADATSPAQLQACAAAVARSAAQLAMPYPALVAVSARTGAGIQALSEHIAFAARLHRLPPP